MYKKTCEQIKTNNNARVHWFYFNRFAFIICGAVLHAFVMPGSMVSWGVRTMNAAVFVSGSSPSSKNPKPNAFPILIEGKHRIEKCFYS